MYRRNWAMVVLVVANFMDLMDTTVVNVALPSIQQDLDASPAALEWTVSAYTLGFAALLITGGRLGDIIGTRSVFLIGVAGFTIASTVAAAAGSGEVLVISRALQGSFAGLMVPQVLAGVQALYPPEERAPVYGLVGFITGTASVVGPILSGAIVTTGAFGLGWRAIFLINLPIGIALLIAARRLVPQARSEHPTRLDLVGVLLAMAGVLCLVFPLIEGRAKGWPWWSWLMLALAPLILVGFVGWQRRAERVGRTPLIPLRLFTDRGYRAGSLVNFCFQAGLVSFFLFFTLYLQQGLAYSAIRAGLVWLGLSLGALAGSAAAAALTARFGRRLMAVGALLFALSMILVARFAVSPHIAVPAWWQFAGVLVVGGVGMGLVIVPVFDAALENVVVADAGSASGALNTIQQVGGSFGVAAIGAVFYGSTSARPGVDGITHAVHLSVLGSALALLLCAAASLLFRPRAAADAVSRRADAPVR